jgi:hypothetical protein
VGRTVVVCFLLSARSRARPQRRSSRCSANMRSTATCSS